MRVFTFLCGWRMFLFFLAWKWNLATQFHLGFVPGKQKRCYTFMINSTGSLSHVFQTVIGRVPAPGGGVTDEPSLS